MQSAALIKAYAKDPIGNNVMEDFDVSMQQENSVCGDMIVVYLKIAEDAVVTAFSRAGAPQMFTIAAASLLTEELLASPVSVDEILAWNYATMQDLGFEVSPRRRRSAVSALLAVRNAIHSRKRDGVVDTYEDLLL